MSAGLGAPHKGTPLKEHHKPKPVRFGLTRLLGSMSGGGGDLANTESLHSYAASVASDTKRSGIRACAAAVFSLLLLSLQLCVVLVVIRNRAAIRILVGED